MFSKNTNLIHTKHNTECLFLCAHFEDMFLIEFIPLNNEKYLILYNKLFLFNMLTIVISEISKEIPNNLNKRSFLLSYI